MSAANKNPFSLSFGKEPIQVISRAMQTADVIDAFTGDPPPIQIFLITGVRGCGKTVFMADIANRLARDKSWVTVELNPEKDLLQSLAAKLYNNASLTEIFKKAKINLSLFGIGLEVSGGTPIYDIETAISEMIGRMKKHGKRLLITIDEVTGSNQFMKVFVSSFQILLRQDLPIYLLMTGLFDNIRNLQNEKSLTFLYRAPMITLKPLNIRAVADSYRKVFDCDEGRALKMAKLTRGYSFAFQVLGYFTWECGGSYEDTMDEYRRYIEEYSYEKIWSELSAGDRKILYGVAKAGTGKIKDVRDVLSIDTNAFNPYRKRLIKRGLLNGSEYGHVRFTLPLFEDFVLQTAEDEELI